MSTGLRTYNAIYDSIKNAVKPKCANVVRTVADLKPAGYPAVVVQLLGSRETADLQANGMGADISYQIDVYAAGARKHVLATDIMLLACGAFRKMGFVPDIRDGAGTDSPTTCRMTGRFYSYIGSGDRIDNF